jgi:hypothetical protein
VNSGNPCTVFNSSREQRNNSLVVTPLWRKSRVRRIISIQARRPLQKSHLTSMCAVKWTKQSINQRLLPPA